ncbi:uncharacterized protein [Physcomitrium patens]|uniref:Uncharacterized protein n=1 Tax=Physcomitrium patens TaxID=3218 RepID=A0A2K1KBU5_PHYPA|nr:uncharacterized protein LOC112284902 [Physcomitrium patens]PNR51254.1 hypothetical protein PHYPA_010440 [Physcomitrium patens]|eukprot:XP_024381027.1 uncharacterized protein LOC112284902 [Physcomitrella patens]
MKKYARLRQDCSEFDNVLYNASPEKYSFDDGVAHSQSTLSQGSASPVRDSPPGGLAVRPAQPARLTTVDPPFHSDLNEALKKLASSRENGSQRLGEQWQVSTANGGNRSRSQSGRWPGDLQDGGWDSQVLAGSGRWGTAETASLSGRWGSVSTNDHWDGTQQGINSFRDSLSLSRSGRLVQEGEPWTAATTQQQPANSQPIQKKPSLQSAPSQGRTNEVTEHEATRACETAYPYPGNGYDQQHHTPPPVQRNISMRETQGWLASVKRPLQTRKQNAWEDPNEFNWRAAAATTNSSSGRRRQTATVSQSMRYDRLKPSDLFANSGAGSRFDDEGYHHNKSIMQKAASMREGGAHSDAIMAMARAYSEKHGVQQAILECVSCRRSLGVVVQGNPGNDTSYCQSCRPHAIGGWTYNMASKPDSSKSKRKGMMNFCRKILRMGKKPNKLKG